MVRLTKSLSKILKQSIGITQQLLSNGGARGHLYSTTETNASFGTEGTLSRLQMIQKLDRKRKLTVLYRIIVPSVQ